jgi:LacI family transcriptional regulator/LacI family asc operon transcriptional repressor
VICTNDSIAVGAVKFAKERGLSIPREMNIVGYNNSVLAISCEPEISSIDNHTEEICDGTIENVIRVLQGDSEVKRHFTVPCTLVKRSTTDF